MSQHNCITFLVYSKFALILEVAIYRYSVERCSKKRRRTHINFKFIENYFLIQLQPYSCNFTKKETLTLMFPLNFAKIFLNSLFVEHLRSLKFEDLL